MKKKVISTICLSALIVVIAISLMACENIDFGGNDDPGTTPNQGTEVDENGGNFAYTAEDADGLTEQADISSEEVLTTLTSTEEWIASSVEYSGKDTATEIPDTATVIVLADDATVVTGEGATVEDNVVTINAVGDYVLSGTLTDGRIYVNVDGNVHLYLNGVDITSSDSAVIALFGKKKKVVTIVEGTTNTLTDGQEYTVFYNEDNDEPNGCLFCKNNLTINGEGTLVVNGNYNNGISCKDDLIIYSGNITVTAKNNGIKGNDNLIIHSGTISVTAEGDGLKSDNEDADMGNVYVEGGNITIVAGEDGIQAYSRLIVTGGTINVTTGGGAAANTTVHTDNMWGGTTSEDETSMKGLKSDILVQISGGTITVDANDDAVHSNSTVIIEDGTLTLQSGDDGIHADELVAISGGEITVTKSYEGLEGAKVYVYGGDINLISTDDGINAADGTDSNSMARNANCLIEIDGGKVYVNAQGDGLDSNGDLIVNGGTVLVNGPTSGANASIDANGNILINGGILVAVGASGMVETPSTSSGQYCLVYSGSNVAANTVLTVKDASGSEILTFTTAKTAQSVIISAPAIKSGSTYTLYAGSNTLATFTVNGKVTSSGNSGGMGGNMGGGMGGPGGMGGMSGPGGRNAAPSDNSQTGGDGETPSFSQDGEMPTPPDMNGELPQMDGQMPGMNGQQPPEMNGEFPQMDGQMPGMNGQQPPEMNGEFPQIGGQMPNMGGQMPQQGGQRPDMNGQPPQMNGEMPTPPDRSGQTPQLDGNAA